MLYLVDLSNHNAGFDVAEAVNEGYAGFIIKSSQGTWYQDPYFEGFAQAAINANAIPGAYHWLENGNGAEQAQILHERVQNLGGPNGWLCACDCEDDSDWNTVVDFFQAWNQLSGGHPLLMYSGNWWWSERGWTANQLTPYLWDSRYVSGSGYGSELYEQVPDSWWIPRYGGWTETTILQFSDKATIAGMVVDVDAFRGTTQELYKLTGKVGMEQTDTMIKGPAPWRTIGDCLADIEELRCWLMGETVPTKYMPAGTSPLRLLVTAAEAVLTNGQIQLTDEQLQALADKVAPLVAAQVAATVGENLSKLITAIAAAGSDLAQLGTQPSTYRNKGLLDG